MHEFIIDDQFESEPLELDEELASRSVETDERSDFVSAQDLMSMSMNRLRNEDVERGMLNEIMRNPDAQIEAVTSLKPDDFFDQTRKEIFTLIQDMFFNRNAISHKDVEAFVELKAKPKSIPYIKEELKQIVGVIMMQSLRNGISILKELRKNRLVKSEILLKSSAMFDNGDSIEDIINHMSKTLVSVETHRKEIKITEVADNAVDALLNPSPENEGLPIGLHEFDQQFGGLRKDTYLTIGALSGTGKTAVAIDIMDRLLERHAGKVAVLFFSMEMSEQRIVNRFISRKTGMTIQHMESKVHKLTDAERESILKAHSEIKRYPLEIVYATMNCHQLRLRMRRFALQNPDKHLVVVLDHMGLVLGETSDMRVNTIMASSVVKSFCVDYGASCLNLTQFTKAADSPQNASNYYRPSMSYIMESGRVRQDSDVVILLWRPEIWFPTIDYGGNEQWVTQGKMVFMVEKNRDGFAPCDIILNCNIGTNKLTNSHETFN